MKQILLRFLFLSLALQFSSLARAATNANATAVNGKSSTPVLAVDTIKQGIWQVGGNFNFSTYNQDLGQLFSVNPDLSYFVTDQLAVGAVFGYYYDYSKYQGTVTRTTVGPQLDYHFFTSGPVSFHVGQKLIQNLTNGKYSGTVGNWRGGTSVGALYLLSANVGFGLTVNYEYGLSSTIRDFSKVAMNGSFAIFL